MRDARKQLSEQQRSAQNENKDPKSGEKSPTDPAERMGKARRDKEGKAGESRDDNVPAWVTALPPEIRDALAGGQAEKIPAKYRHLIARYNLFLQKQGAKNR